MTDTTTPPPLEQTGLGLFDAAGYFSTTADTIERTYGHHSPAHQSSAIRAVERRGRDG